MVRSLPLQWIDLDREEVENRQLAEMPGEGGPDLHIARPAFVVLPLEVLTLKLFIKVDHLTAALLDLVINGEEQPFVEKTSLVAWGKQTSQAT